MFIIEQFYRFIAPDSCLSCGREGALICLWCYPDAFEQLPGRCYHCHKQTPDSAVCANCRRLAPLKHVWVATSYEIYAKQLLKRFKFERSKDVAEILAEVMDEHLPYLPETVVITYVPTATSRIRQRGYDQAAELAEAFAAKRGLKFAHLLNRSGQVRQVGAKREQRLSQLGQAFKPRNNKLLKNSEILLIDDIVTTGATLQAASKVLKQAGARKINAAVFAQKQ